MQCSSCYNRHRSTSVVCLANMPHAVSAMVPGVLYDIDTTAPAATIDGWRRTASRGRLALVDLVLTLV